jgi:hypothetical protein
MNMPNQTEYRRGRIANARIAAACAVAVLAPFLASSAFAQSAREVLGAAAVEPLENEPAAKIIIDPPLAEPLSSGRIVIQYRTENLHTVPVFGPAALAVSPRIGHIHLSVDDAPWVWVNASGEPVILNGLAPGPHKVLLQLETANHQLLDEGSVKFTVPAAPGMAHSGAAVESVQNGPPAKLIVDAPLAEPLSRGVLFVQYRAENLRIVPVFGPAALAVSPRVGHIHVTVDDATWHWADSSGGPIIINGLQPGRHKVLIQLVNANHQPIDQDVVQFTLPVALVTHESSVAHAGK